jgi:hypothetical protein
LPKETTRIVSTSLRGLFPLGGRGSHGQLTDSLLKRFGPRHAALLAEPEPVADGSAIDWYVPGESKGARLADLEPVARSNIEADLDRLSSDIRGYADELEQPHRSAAERSLGLALRSALQVPSSDYIYAIGAQPVLVAWGHRLDKEPALPVGLVRRHEPVGAHGPAGRLVAPGTEEPNEREAAEAAAPHPPFAATPPGGPIPAPPSPVQIAMPAINPVTTRTPWPLLLWPLFALLVAAILWTLLKACALNVGNAWYPSPSWCVVSVAASGGGDRISDLQALIANLEEQLARRTRECQLQVPQRPPDHAAPIDQREIERRVRREGVDLGGELQISLAWDGPADFDLHVRCADGQTINHGNKSACGGALDIDMNHERHTLTPVENVTFPSIGRIPPGKITIRIARYEDHGDDRDVIPATVVIRRPGHDPEEFKVEMRKPSSGHGPAETVREITIP